MLHEDAETPPERLLRAIWHHQRVARDRLLTADGRSVRVFHPGFLSREGGPDFRKAILQFAEGPVITGDVEVDIHASGWRAHRHHVNPAFARVILRVIWEGAAPSGIGPPVLPLANVIDAPVASLSYWLSADADSAPSHLRGLCAEPLLSLPEEQIMKLMREAGQIRFQSKAEHLQARARQAGWEQALWEGLFRALGYKHNSWPMLCLAELRDRWAPAELSPVTLQARLFGIGGLLPDDFIQRNGSAGKYLRVLWDHWWRERDRFGDCALSSSLWRFHGLRPANHPHRRLALAAHWLASETFVDRIEHWCGVKSQQPPAAWRALVDALRVEHDPFWSWHWTLRSARLKREQPLLGTSRATDLAVNVLLPWLWIRAREGGNEKVQAAIQRCYESWPAAQDNAVLRLARQRLFIRGKLPRCQAACEQQGLLQIVRDFCDHSNALCNGCRFPELVARADCA